MKRLPLGPQTVTFNAMSAASLLEQLRALPPAEHDAFLDALLEAEGGEILRRLEDQHDIEASDRALAEWDGKTTVKLEDLMREMGDEL